MRHCAGCILKKGAVEKRPMLQSQLVEIVPPLGAFERGKSGRIVISTFGPKNIFFEEKKIMEQCCMCPDSVQQCCM